MAHIISGTTSVAFMLYEPCACMALLLWLVCVWASFKHSETRVVCLCLGYMVVSHRKVCQLADVVACMFINKPCWTAREERNLRHVLALLVDICVWFLSASTGLCREVSL